MKASQLFLTLLRGEKPARVMTSEGQGLAPIALLPFL